MPADLSLLLPRYQRAKNRWNAHSARLQEIAEFLLPYQSNITIFGAEGRKKTQRLYHSAGIVAADKLARTMHGTVTPSAFEWHSPVMRQEELNAIKPIRSWLQDCSKRMYAARRQSNFSLAAGRFYASLCTLGTGAMFPEERPAKRPGQFGGLHYNFLPMGTYAIEQSGDEVVDTLYRDLKWPVRSLADKFGVNALPEDTRRKLADKPDEEVEFVHAIYPRKARDPRKDNTKNWPFASCYFIRKGDGADGASILSESGFRERPFMVTRWDVAQREVWGIGPGHLAYPDVRSLNEIRKFKLMAGGTAVLPPTIKTQKVLLTEVSLAPGAVMIRDDGNPNMPALEVFDNKAKFNVAELLEEDMTSAINDIYYILELMLPDKGNMTLGEAQIRVEERQRLLGPTMGRLEAEWLGPLFEREFAIMLRAGAFAEPPPELVEAVGAGEADIDVEWEGPLARAQRSGELLAMDRFNQHVFTVAAVVPETLDRVNWDKQLDVYAEVTGVNPETLNDDARTQQIRDARAKAQQQQQQAAGLAQMAESVGKVAPALKAIQSGTQTTNAA